MDFSISSWKISGNYTTLRGSIEVVSHKCPHGDHAVIYVDYTAFLRLYYTALVANAC